MCTSSEKNMGGRAFVLRLNESSEIHFFFFILKYMSVVQLDFCMYGYFVRTDFSVK